MDERFVMCIQTNSPLWEIQLFDHRKSFVNGILKKKNVFNEIICFLNSPWKLENLKHENENHWKGNLNQFKIF